MAPPRGWFVIFPLLFAACSEASEPPSGSADASVQEQTDASEPGDPAILVGSFQVRLIPPSGETPGYTAVFGKIYDGPTPVQIILEESMSAGECRLVEPRVPFCDPACSGGAICVEDGVCQAYPSAHSAGAVRVSGLITEGGATEFDMTPIANNYQPPASVDLPFPAFAESDAITISAAGDFYKAFTADAKGIAPLVLTNTDLALARDTALDVVWTPAGSVDSKIFIKLDISHHGGTKGQIECEAADDGALQIPGSMITALLDLGVAGFPTIVVARRTSGSGVIDQGRVDLIISSDLELSVDVPGVVSCLDDQECENGTTCQADLTCR